MTDKPDYLRINRLEQELGIPLSDYTSELGSLITTGVKAVRDTWAAKPEPPRAQKRPAPKPNLPAIEFTRAAKSCTTLVFDKVVNGEYIVPIPATGWLRYLTVKTEPEGVTLTRVTDINGDHIYYISNGLRSAQMYPETEGYRIPFEWSDDGRGSLPNKNVLAAYQVTIVTNRAQRVTVNATSYNDLPEKLDGYFVQQSPPAVGSLLKHFEAWFPDASNWSVRSPFNVLSGGHVLHRIWPFPEKRGIYVVSAVELIPGR